MKIAFNEATTFAPGTTVRARDADGTTADLICGTNATCTLNAAAETLGGVSRAPQTVLTVSSHEPGHHLDRDDRHTPCPGDGTDRTGITDLAGNAWNLAGSADIVLGSPD